MKRYFNKRSITTKNVMAMVELVKATKRFLAVIGMIGLLWSYVPWNVIKADTSDPIVHTEETVEAQPGYPTTTDADFDPSLVEIDSEVISERTENSKTFRKIDGTYEVALYNDVIHFYENGEWIQVDNSLNDIGDELETNLNKFKLKFPKYLDDNKQIKLTMGDYSIDWNLLNINSAPIEVDNQEMSTNSIKELLNINQSVLYSNIQPYVDVEYIVSGSKVKENIILNQYIPDFSITFEYKLKDLSLVETEDGEIVFINVNGDAIFKFSDLIMYDNELNESLQIQYILVDTGNKTYELTIIPDSSWLQNAAYPVVIDPTITNVDQNVSFYDTYVMEWYPSTNYEDDTWIRVNNSSLLNNDKYGLVKFDIPSNLTTKNLTYAHLFFERFTAPLDSQTNIFRNTSDFNPESVTFNTKPSYDPEIVDYSRPFATSLRMFDVTKTVREWIEGTYNNYGFTLFQKDEHLYNTDLYSSENSSHSPVLIFGYVDTSGVKDYWTYNTSSAGEAGSGLISDFSGELTFIRNEFNFTTEKQSLSFSLIYNISRKDTNIGYGLGWQTNYSMTLDYDDDLDLWFVIDGTGNKVYYQPLDSCDDRFPEDSPPYSTHTCWIAEDGSQQVLVKQTIYMSPTIYYIVTLDQVRYDFGSDEYLDKITDERTTLSITITRDLSNLNHIEEITDSSGNLIDLTYDSYGNLYYSYLKLKQNDESLNTVEYIKHYYTSRSYYSDRALYYTYHYTNYDSEASAILYNREYYYTDTYARLTGAYEYLGQRVTYTYDTSNDRINTVKQYSNNDQIFGELSYSYDYKKTTITDQDGYFVIYKFDNYGHTVNILDKYGVAQSFAYLNQFSFGYMNEPNYYINNKLVSQSSPQKTQHNVINNYSFEVARDYDSNWGLYQTWYPDQDTESTYTCSTSLFGECSATISAPSSTYYGSYYQEVNLDAGNYLLSLYVKNDGSTNNVTVSVEGDTLESTSQQVENDGEWHYITLLVDVDYANTDVTIFLNSDTVGSVYFDNVQLLEGFRDTRKNIVDNASFEEINGSNEYNNWFEDCDDSSDIYPYFTNSITTNLEEEIFGDYAVRIEGDGEELKSIGRGFYNYLNQDMVDGKLVIGGWAYSESTPIAYQPGQVYSELFAIKVDILESSEQYGTYDYYQAIVDEYYIIFDASIEGWQYKLEEVPYEAGTYIYLSLQFQGEGYVLFDNIQMYYEGINTNYEYDAIGRITQTSNSVDNATAYSYDNNNDSRPTSVSTGSVILDLGIDDEAALVDVVTFNNVTSEIGYNSFGQVTSTSVGDTSEYFTTSTTYLSTGFSQYVSVKTDEFGNDTHYYTNTLNGLLKAIRDAENNDLLFIYDNKGNLSKVIHVDNYSTYDDGDPYYAMIEYRYDSENRLSDIVMEQDANGTPTYYYHLTYDAQDRIEEVFINNQSLMKYTYNDGTTYHSNQLSEQRYGNDDVMVFHYNDEDQIESIEFGQYVNEVLISETRFSYEYDQSGNIAVYKEHDENGDVERVEYYTFDSAGRLDVMVDSDNNRVDYDYDSQGNVTSIDFTFADVQHAVEYYHNLCLLWDQYGNCDQSSTLYEETTYTTISDEDVERNYQYESGALKRLDNIYLIVDNNIIVTSSFDYDESRPRLDAISYSIAGDSTTYKYSYYYDDLGNIDDYRYYENTSIKFRAQYEYDELNQLLVESLRDFSFGESVLTDTNYTKYFEYDKMGNILSQKTYLFGQEQFLEVTIPTTAPSNSYGNIDIFEVVIGDTTIDIGDSLDLTYYYYLDNYSFPPDPVPMPMYTTCDDTNIDYYTAGYYILECDAHGKFGSDYLIYFEVLIKVGNPVGGPTPTQEELIYTYSDTWKDQLESIEFIDNNNSSNDVTYEVTSYDGQGNPLTITHLEYNGYTFEQANFSWDGRQLSEIFFDDLYSQSNNYLNEDIFWLEPNTVGTDESVLVKANTYYTFYMPDSSTLEDIEVDIYLDDVLVISESAEFPDVCYESGGKFVCTFYTGTSRNFDIEITARDIDMYVYYLGLDGIQLNEGQTVLPHQDYIAPKTVTISYSYNDGGYRTEKYINDCTASVCVETKTTYFLQGDIVLSELTQELNGSTWVDQFIIVYTFDYDGTIISFHYDDLTDQVDGKEYFYVRNQQRDIMKIVDISGNILVEYRYDTWGNVIDVWLDLSQEHEDESIVLAEINQYFYRGYRYDSEIQMYYLNSRFYNPLFGRFLNADGLLGAQGNVLGHNMYAYTRNNPVRNMDGTGYMSEEMQNILHCVAIVAAVALTVYFTAAIFGTTAVATSLAFGVVSAGAQVYSNYQNGEDLGKNITGAFIGGYISGAVGGIGGQIAAGFINAGINQIENVLWYEEDVGKAIKAFFYEGVGYSVGNAVMHLSVGTPYQYAFSVMTDFVTYPRLDKYKDRILNWDWPTYQEILEMR